jgi:type I restriction enzyme S subunit
MSGLPQNWVDAKVGDLITIRNGYAFKSVDFLDEGVIPAIRQTNLSTPIVNFKNPKYLPENFLKLYPQFHVNKGDWLIGLSGSIGNVALYNEEYPALQNQRTGLLLPRKKESLRFVKYYLLRIQDDLEKAAKGVAVQNISSKIIEEWFLPLPPLDEQIRIADKLDSVLAKVDVAQVRLEKIPTLLKRFRQSVLTAATSGELTRECRETSETRNDFLTWKFSNIPGSWKIKLLPEVSEARLGKMLDKNKNQGVPTRYLGNINVRWGKFNLDDLKEILISEKEREELKIQDGDLLLCEGGEPGRGAVWKGEKCDLTFQKALHRVRFDGSVLPEFALFCIENDYFQNRLSLLYTGTTIKHLTGKALKKYPIPVPPVDEQKEIIRRVESLFALAGAVEKQYLETKKRTDRLTQSLLAKAFRGELVPQDPNDEPAAELLKRIQAERNAQPPVKNKRKQQA